MNGMTEIEENMWELFFKQTLGHRMQIITVYFESVR